MTHDLSNAQAPTTVGALPAPVADLLAAIVEALDVPLADRPVDDQQRAELLIRRAADTRILLASLLTHRDIPHTVIRLREWTSENPVTYTTWQARTMQAAAEEQQLLDEDAKGSAPVRTPGGEPEIADTGKISTEARCPAAHPSDPDPCVGPVVVTVLDATNAGADGCEHHAARLLASIDGGRVYGLPGAPEGTAVRVFTAAASIRPFPWIDVPRTRPEQLSLNEVRARGEHR